MALAADVGIRGEGMVGASVIVGQDIGRKRLLHMDAMQVSWISECLPRVCG